MRNLPELLETLPDDAFPLMIPCDPDTGAVILDCFSLTMGDTQGESE